MKRHKQRSHSRTPAPRLETPHKISRLTLSERGWWLSPFAQGGALILLAVLVYLPILKGGFLWDDDGLLTTNPHMRSVQGLVDLWIAPKTQDYFPLTLSFLWVQWQWWGETNPAGYHMVCLLLHTINGLLIWAVLARLRIPGSWLAAVLFVVHPQCVESVAWISEIKNTFSLPFLLLSIYSWTVFDERVDASRWFVYWGSVALFALALLAKTSVVGLPIFLLVLIWQRRGVIRWPDIWCSTPYFAASIILGIVTLTFQHTRAVGSEDVPIGGLLSRLAGAGMALCFYLFKSFVPTNLMIVYPRWPINPPVWWTFFFGLAFLALVLCCLRWRRTASGGAGLLALSFFSLMVAPVLGLVKMSYMRHTLVADHFVYVSLIGSTALVAAAVATVWATASSTMKSRIVGGTVLIVAFLSWQSSNYATVFQNQETLWRSALQRNPAAWAGHCNLGGVELERGNLEAAGQHIQEAARLAPQVAETHYNLALWHLRTGHPIEAAKAAEEAVRLGPSLARHHSVWILARLQSGQLAWADAVKDYETLLQLEPDNAAALNNFSMALISAGQFERASQASEHSIALAPDNIEYLNTLALTQSATRHYPEAIATYRKALALKSDHVSTLIGLAWLLATNEVCSQPEEAVRLAEKAVSLTSRHDPGALDTLAAACAAAGKFPQAVQHAETALSIAQAAGQVELQKECTARLALYREGRPYREERAP